MKMQNETYDKLKLIAWILAPVITFVGALCSIWGIEHADKITATLAAFDTLLGSLLTISNMNYYKENNDDV